MEITQRKLTISVFYSMKWCVPKLNICMHVLFCPGLEFVLKAQYTISSYMFWSFNIFILIPFWIFGTQLKLPHTLRSVCCWSPRVLYLNLLGCSWDCQRHLRYQLLAARDLHQTSSLPWTILAELSKGHPRPLHLLPPPCPIVRRIRKSERPWSRVSWTIVGGQRNKFGECDACSICSR